LSCKPVTTIPDGIFRRRPPRSRPRGARRPTPPGASMSGFGSDSPSRSFLWPARRRRATRRSPRACSPVGGQARCSPGVQKVVSSSKSSIALRVASLSINHHMLQQALAMGNGCGSWSVRSIEFAHDVGDMDAGGLLADEEPVRSAGSFGLPPGCTPANSGCDDGNIAVHGHDRGHSGRSGRPRPASTRTGGLPWRGGMSCHRSDV
jgi:hypothetical protein